MGGVWFIPSNGTGSKMKLRDLLAPVDYPAVYFMEQTAFLRERVSKLEAAARDALALLNDGDAEPEDADAVTAKLREALNGPA